MKHKATIDDFNTQLNGSSPAISFVNCSFDEQLLLRFNTEKPVKFLNCEFNGLDLSKCRVGSTVTIDECQVKGVFRIHGSSFNQRLMINKMTADEVIVTKYWCPGKN